MSRQAIRETKRVFTQGQRHGANAVSVGLAQEASLHLLQRSIRFGHTRLSVLRLVMAAQTGVAIPAACWDFCHRIAASSSDTHTQALFQEAMHMAGGTSMPTGNGVPALAH